MRYTEFKSKKSLDKLISQEKKAYFDAPDCDVLYEKGFTVKGKAFNYLNSKSSDSARKVFRPLITSVFDELESVYPSTGEIFLKYVMRNITSINSQKIERIEKECDEVIAFIKENSKNIHRNDFESFLNSEISIENRVLISDIVDNISVDTKIYIEKSLINKTILSKTNDYTFNLEFDTDFLLKNDTWSAKDYKFILIDGYVDSVGEIYHLLTKASENLEQPYVVFCKGMNPEVKNVIIQNLIRGTINLFPISLEINELNLNILADIAMCHNSDVVSSLQGETISMVTRRNLKSGRKITIGKNYFTLKPLISKSRIENHKSYLQKRKSITNTAANTELLDLRLKMLNADKLSIKVGLSKLENNDFITDLKKITYFLKNGSSGIVCVDKLDMFSSFCNSMPSLAALKLMHSIKSFCKIIYNTSGAIIIK